MLSRVYEGIQEEIANGITERNPWQNSGGKAVKNPGRISNMALLCVVVYEM